MLPNVNVSFVREIPTNPRSELNFGALNNRYRGEQMFELFYCPAVITVSFSTSNAIKSVYASRRIYTRCYVHGTNFVLFSPTVSMRVENNAYQANLYIIFNYKPSSRQQF